MCILRVRNQAVSKRPKMSQYVQFKSKNQAVSKRPKMSQYVYFKSENQATVRVYQEEELGRCRQLMAYCSLRNEVKRNEMKICGTKSQIFTYMLQFGQK